MSETKIGKMRWLLVAIVATFLTFAVGMHGSQAATGINSQIAFQGKLVNTDGTNVADGTYNMQFKIYQDGSGTGGGTLKWTETRLVSNSQGVTVTAGTFQVNLGSVTALSGIDFNQDTLWLSMNVGGTNSTSSPTYDGEMSPYIRLTSVPYALNAGAVGGLTASQLVQLNPSSVQSGAINVNGAVQLNTSGSSASSTSVGTNTGAAQTITIGGSGASGGSNSATTVISQGGSTATTLNNTGLAVQTYTNSALAFQVQNAAGTDMLTVDTTNAVNYLTNPGFGIGSSGWSYSGSGTSCAITSANENAYIGSSSLDCTLASSGNSTVTTSSFTTAIAAGTYTFSFYAKASTTVTLASTVSFNGGGTCTLNSTAVTTGGFQRYTCSVTTTGATTSIAIGVTTTGTSNHIYFDGAQLQAGSLATPYYVGALQLRSVVTDPVSIAPGSNSTTAFQVQDTTGTSNLLVADTLNGKLTLAGNSLTATQFQRTTSGGGTFTFDLSDTSATTFKLFNSGAGVANLWLYGGGLYTGSGQTLRIDNSGNLSNIGTISSTGAATIVGTLQVGSNTANTSSNLLVLNNYSNGTTEPTASAGAMYYNSALGAFRCAVGTAWRNCAPGVAYGVSTYVGGAGNPVTTSTAGTIYLVPMYVSGQTTVNTMRLNVSTALGAAGDVGIYNAAGTLVLNGGSSSVSTATGVKAVTPVQTGATRILEPGQYYAAVTTNSTSGAISAVTMPNPGLINRVGTTTGGGLTLPATITPSSITNTAYIVLMSFNN